MTDTSRVRSSSAELLGAVPRLVTRARRNPPPENVALVGLLLVSGLLLLGGLVVSESVFSPSTQVIPLLVGGLLLGRHALRRLLLFVGGCLVWDMVTLGIHGARPGAMTAVAVTGLIAHEFARSRDETGLGGLRGDSVLVELRNRLELQGALPPLPAPWSAETVLRPAGGGPFAGDFLVSARADGGQRLDLALVDVSGKGVDAGSRALLLSGALGGLLGALPPEEFLGAANEYLCDQNWEEGFATAVHLTVDLRCGSYAVSSAGHPPPAHLHAGSGRWSLIEVAAPALGLLPGARYDVQRGRLEPGDALVLYTDGLVEIPGRDLSVGIDKLMGAAEHLVAGGFTGGAEQLVDRVAAHANDDRGLVLLWRGR
ncbi:MAG: serine/threonine-protein phosphatase [Actinobacteria bacterium]|nr:serine/threonine-protein phosphatase [Actinomycetota bacterium]MCA1722407.1 serine/threonine-protein phosphatase [Actinomycetota bacterium]